MSVKKKDRHISKNDCLMQARELVKYILVLIRPREFDKDGKQIRKPGHLGEGQPLQAFGLDIFNCGKRLHGACYQASKIYLHDEKTLHERAELYQQAIEYCDSIFRLLDLCIYTYGETNKKNKNSFEHCARLNLAVKRSIQERLNRDKMIYDHCYRTDRHYRR